MKFPPRRSTSKLIGSDLPFFKLSEYQWDEIRPTLPPDIAGAPEQARRTIEKFGRHYKGEGLPNNALDLEKSWHLIAKLSRQLAQQIRKTRRSDRYLEWFVLVCDDLEEEALVNADQYEILAMNTRGRRRPNRELLYGALAQFWTVFGGKLRYSRAGKQPSGPAVRFFTAVLPAIMGADAPKLEGIVSIIEREARSRSIW